VSVTALHILSVLAASAGWATGDARVAAGREVYEAACQACHGQDGRGNPDWESDVAAPDLADCATTSERGDHWEDIVAKGGRAFGLASVMPAFGETLTASEIGSVVAYLRTLCEDADRYPPGELNPRRLLAVGKAFPETEAGLAVSHGLDPGQDTLLRLRYERRWGSRLGYGFKAPFRAADAEFAGFSGLGNIELEAKWVPAFHARRGEIVALGLEVETPTGEPGRSLGHGIWVWKPFVAFAKGAGRTTAQGKLALSLPQDLDHDEDRLIQYGFGLSRSLGRPRTAWTPAAELVGAFNLRRRDFRHEMVVEISRPLSRLGHVVASAGLRFPLGGYAVSPRLEAHVLWDFSEGPPWRGF
jgi:mono/diheme cytochrome c family protein